MRAICFLIFLLVPLLLTAGCSDPGEDEFNKGIEAERIGNLDLAQQMFEEALKKDPSIAEAHIDLGLIHIKKEEFDLAWQETMIGLEMVKKTQSTIVMGGKWQDQASLAYNNLAKIIFNKALEAHKAGDLELRQQHREHAISLLEQAVELSPESELAIKNLAYIRQWPN